ncbi:hypothetical protein VI817_004008 [Penicillium citrinum]|nr:hypothetical protein VI817_004008 [Penicillium citrinum]
MLLRWEVPSSSISTASTVLICNSETTHRDKSVPWGEAEEKKDRGLRCAETAGGMKATGQMKSRSSSFESHVTYHIVNS